MTTLNSIFRKVRATGRGATGLELMRMTYTGRMAGSQWRTLAGYMVKAQNGVCAVCGIDDMVRGRAANPESIALMPLLDASHFGTPQERNALRTSTGKAIDPYRIGYVEGNIVVAHVDCARMVRGERVTAALLAINADQIITTWTTEMTRKAKPLKPEARNDNRRAAQARGWIAKG